MQQLLNQWTPYEWQTPSLNSDKSDTTYITQGRVSGTFYVKGKGESYCSAFIIINDLESKQKASAELAKLATLKNCTDGSYAGYQTRTCFSKGETLSRSGIVYAAGRFLVKISVIGVDAPQLNASSLNLPLPHTYAVSQ